VSRPNPFKLSLALVGALALAACVLANKFDRMIAVVNGKDVAFTLPAGDLGGQDRKFMLHGIGVSAIECDRDCVRWEMLRPADSNTDPVEGNFAKFPIRYGVLLPNMQTRVQKNLGKGEYRVTASFAIVENGQVSDTRKVIGVFTIK
jgi:hypothetical protein